MEEHLLYKSVRIQVHQIIPHRSIDLHIRNTLSLTLIPRIEAMPIRLLVSLQSKQTATDVFEPCLPPLLVRRVGDNPLEDRAGEEHTTLRLRREAKSVAKFDKLLNDSY